MRKLTLLTVLLLVLGMTFCFGQDAIKPIIVATATLNWGIDLDTMYSGFSDVLSADVYVPLITNQTFDDKGTGPIYGQITLTNMELTARLDYQDAGNATTALVGPTMTLMQKVAAGGSFTAKIVATPIEIGVYAAPALSLARATVFANTNLIYGTLQTTAPDQVFLAATDPIMDTLWTLNLAPTVYNTSVNTGATEGTWITYTMAPMTLTARVVSDGTKINNTKNGYAGGAEVSLALTPLTVGLGAYQGVNFSSNPTLFWTTLAFAQEMGAMKVAANAAVDVAFDGTLAAANQLKWDASAGATLYISAVNDKNGKPQYVNYIGANALLGTPYGAGTTANPIDLGVHVIAFHDGTNGFLPNLAMQVDAWLMYLMTTRMEYDLQ